MTNTRKGFFAGNESYLASLNLSNAPANLVHLGLSDVVGYVVSQTFHNPCSKLRTLIHAELLSLFQKMGYGLCNLKRIGCDLTLRNSSEA